MAGADDKGGGCIVVGYLLLNVEEFGPFAGPGPGTGGIGIALLVGGMGPRPGV